MLLPRTQAPLRAALAASRSQFLPSTGSAYNVLDVLRAGSSPSPTLTFVRHATHQAQGRANGPKNGVGKRMGAKKTGEQYVVPGNIIFKQRGTLWFPGENCLMGRDHTIHAAAPGYVKYYRDPAKHPKRKYIGVVFERNQTLPTPVHAARRRRLGMLAVARDGAVEHEHEQEQQMVEEDAAAANDLVPAGKAVPGNKVPGQESSVRAAPKSKRAQKPQKNLSLRPGYMFREANWEIGRAAERANVKVTQFVKGDRFKAWRKLAARKAKNVARKTLSSRKGAKKAKKGGRR
ncbi:uncharacterized protein K452DRAFT_319705 [Aplosporella prunicola CBS 121167]|uniref:Large ribosomal subunit protein bL27m n=1 Tax=Aplosporella prunicola CBS 121167 TaxID=1176127 RepID=A0A6A6B8B2_9PEZI|nr:uncharacterized protein K452DRAFT_319705 [Aplosporella prunicola CBS 121167]KAF2140156.1 hypothetical protein K452DRAFT_319705 [Aplosporella prunicola CBS 121167]